MSRRTALLVVDVQVDMFSDPGAPVFRGEEMLENILALIDRARASGAPVIYIRHTEDDDRPMGRGKPGWEIHPRIAPSRGDIIVPKTTPSSFYNTGLQELLSSMGIERLVIAGLQTECCIDTTVRHAFCLGYEVVLASDANSTYDIPPLTAPQILRHHHRILGNWFAKVVPSGEIEFG